MVKERKCVQRCKEIGRFEKERAQTRRERGRRKARGGKRDRVRVKGGNPISVLIKPNLFWRVTETAPCHYADLRGRREEK